MMQKSFFHNGTFRGDAYIAPYNDVDFHTALNTLYWHNEAIVKDEDALIKTRVRALVGRADVLLEDVIIKGVYCDCSEQLDVEANTSSYPRMDTIIIKINWNLRQVELLIKLGIPSSYPVPTALQQDYGDIWEHPLAYCYIPAGAAANTLNDDEIYDLINFYPRYSEATTLTVRPINKNILHNGEFLSGEGVGADQVSPAYWSTVGTPTITTEYVAGVVPRNVYPLKITMSSGDELYTEKYLGFNSNNYTNTTIVIQVISGSVDVSVDGGALTFNTVYPTSSPLKFYMKRYFNTAQDVITPHFSTTEDSVFYLWQLTVSPISIAAPIVPYHEYILYGSPKELLNEESRANGTYESPQDEGQSNLLRLVFASALSAASDSIYAAVYPGWYGLLPTDIDAVRVEVGRLPNAVGRENQGWITTATLAVEEFNVVQNSTLGQFGLDSVGIKT